MKKGAEFSECGKYRYALWRIWDESKPLVMFIGLNPSTANHETDDPTIRNVQKIAAFNGYGGVYMMNLFGIISPNPEILRDATIDRFGDNEGWHDIISANCKDVVFAWGNFKEAQLACYDYIQKYPNALCIKKNKNESPVHPLYQKSQTTLIPFK